MFVRKFMVFSSFLALLPLSGRAHCLPAADLTPSSALISERCLAAIHFETAEGLIYVQASLEGSEPLWTILDTGSSFTVFDEPKAKALGLRLRDKGKAYGPGQGASPKLGYASGVRLGFAGTELHNQIVGALPLDWFSRQVGRATDGFLGSNIFRSFVVEVDYSERVLRLYNPATYSYSGPGQRFPLQLAPYNVPRIRASVVAADGSLISGLFLVDTGSASALWLTKAFTDAHPKLLSEGETAEAPSIVAVGGEIRSRVGRMAAIRLGEFVIQKPATKFSQNTSGLFASRDLAGTIGGQTLCYFRVIFDYPHQQMILEPQGHFDDSCT